MNKNFETLINGSGMKKKYIAKKLGISTKTLRKKTIFEEFTAKDLLILSSLLNINIDYFFNEVDTK